MDQIIDKIIDVSPIAHDPITQAPYDYKSRNLLEEYFNSSPGSSTQKLENFTKYVPRQNLARFLARYEIFKRIQNIQGSIIECGVFMGVGLMAFAKISTILEPYNFQRRIFGFDTFTGFPEIDDKDNEGLSERKSKHLKVSGFAADGGYNDILESIKVYDENRFLNHFPKVQLIKGDFNETAVKFLEDHPHLIVSCLYLDFDIYKPTKKALELFLPRMPKGSIIVFDELNEEAFPGETIAVLEVLNMNKTKIERFEFEPRISFAIIGE